MSPSGVRPAAFALETDRGERVVVRAGEIAPPDAPVDFTLELGAAELRAGLINGHDHLFLNHFPRLGAPPYRDLYEWAADVQTNFRDEVARFSRFPRRDALLFGALKNLLGGATTVVHHDRWSRELDGPFPVRVVRVRVLHSLGLEEEAPRPTGRGSGPEDGGPEPEGRSGGLLCVHLAEGTSERAAAEVREADRRGLLGHRVLAVHVVAVDGTGVELLREREVAVVWCPTSNLHLYGRTAPETLLRSGVDVLLGTDSLLSGEGTLLDELRAARTTGAVPEGALVDAVGAVAARRLGVPAPSLEPGAPADLVALRRPLLEARPRDVALVLVGGRPRLADADLAGLFDAARVTPEPLEVGGAEKVVSAPLGSVAEAVVERAPAVGRILG